MVDAVTVCFKKYGVFHGRASRSEYWFFVLAIWIFILAGKEVGAFLSSEFTIIFFSLVPLAFYVPVWAAAVRRMHDVGKNGWYLLIPIYSLILACTASVEDNQYGPRPN